MRNKYTPENISYELPIDNALTAVELGLISKEQASTIVIEVREQQAQGKQTKDK